MSEPGPPSLLECGWAGTALGGAPESGDAHVVAPFAGGVLVAVIDGLGHGPEAAAAAGAAASTLAAHPHEAVAALVERCHEALRGTRGAVMTVASFQERAASLTWLGVGNVEGHLLRARPAAPPRRESVMLRGGVVGYQLPPLRAASLPVKRGDTLVLATDGLRSGFVAGLGAPGVPEGAQELANALLAHYARGSDDALVLVARYLGATP